MVSYIVDHVPNFFVAQKQVDELGYFKIIHLDHGLIFRRDHQIRLDCSFQPYFSGGNSIHSTSRQIYSFEISFNQSCPREVRAVESRTVESFRLEVRFVEVGTD